MGLSPESSSFSRGIQEAEVSVSWISNLLQIGRLSNIERCLKYRQHSEDRYCMKNLHIHPPLHSERLELLLPTSSYESPKEAFPDVSILISLCNDSSVLFAVLTGVHRHMHLQSREINTKVYNVNAIAWLSTFG